MKIAILTCVLGGFDELHDPVKQTVDCDFHRWADNNFPPITGLTPRLQYRIPKYFGWQMLPDYDYYLWLDGAVTLQHSKSLEWFLEQLGDGDIAFFKHPDRNSIKEEVDHIEDHLQRGKPYITARYKNGLHKEQYAEMEKYAYEDDKLYASTAFIYKNTKSVQWFMEEWWAKQSRYFTCDQVVLPYLLDLYKLNVKTFDEHIYKTKYLTMVSHHK
jgi:hypothetical protein